MEFIMRIFKSCLWLVWIISTVGLSTDVIALPDNTLGNIRSHYWATWDQSDESNSVSIDHDLFDRLLSTYVIVDHPSGINRFRYADVSSADRKLLNAYILRLTSLDPRDYQRSEQRAYWLNLYNALVLRSVLRDYPLKILTIESIKAKYLVRVAGVKLSLEDIENRILRPLWQDRKTIFGLSCAALSCPNIRRQAFTSANTKLLLERSVREFINHPRGVNLQNKRLQASQIFAWYGQDFGSTKKMIKFFAHYAEDIKALYLLGFSGEIAYHFDSRLNAPVTIWSP